RQAVRKAHWVKALQISVVIHPEMSVAIVELIMGFALAAVQFVQHLEDILFVKHEFLGLLAVDFVGAEGIINRAWFVMPPQDAPAAAAQVVEKSLAGLPRAGGAQDHFHALESFVRR